MSKEDQQYKIIKFSKKDLIDHFKKNGIKDINYIAVNNVLNKLNKKFGGDKETTLEELQEDMKKQRDKAAEREKTTGLGHRNFDKDFLAYKLNWIFKFDQEFNQQHKSQQILVEIPKTQKT